VTLVIWRVLLNLDAAQHGRLPAALPGQLDKEGSPARPDEACGHHALLERLKARAAVEWPSLSSLSWKRGRKSAMLVRASR